ncbi:MAG: GntR family transcriptional regulator [Rhodospirillales bacterium]|nr:GntR family transcriptional regulator [Rhodospirillales bacterium]
MPAVRRPRDLVYSALKRRIVLNEIAPGDALTELGLARELGCSQGTVREALLRLQEDGLVVRDGHRGTTVTELDPDAAIEILELRKRLETRGALRAVGAYDDRARAELDAIRKAMPKAAQRGDEYGLIELDMRFHATIFRLASPSVLEQILIRCMLHSHRQKLWAPGHRRTLAKTADRHAPLMAALEARDGPRLAREIEHHLDTIVDVEKPAARRGRAA